MRKFEIVLCVLPFLLVSRYVDILKKIENLLYLGLTQSFYVGGHSKASKTILESPKEKLILYVD